MKTQKIKIETPNQAARAVRKTTEFEITMKIEVKNVDGGYSDAASINASVIMAVENIGWEGVVQVLDCHTSQKTFPNGLTSPKVLSVKQIKAEHVRRTRKSTHSEYHRKDFSID